MNDETKKKRPRVALVGLGGGSATHRMLALGLLGSAAARPIGGVEHAPDSAVARRERELDAMVEALNRPPDIIPTSAKGGRKKYIQATRPRWRQPR